jgi:hypothetical protein
MRYTQILLFQENTSPSASHGSTMGSDSDSDDETMNKKSAKRKADGDNDKDKKSRLTKGESYSMKYPGVLVTQTNDRDVLQGRGSGSNLYHGNMVYRDMIDEIATSYTSTTSRKEKNRLVDELINVIHGMNGRFLHPIDTSEATKLGLDPGKDFFFEITDADAVDKVKQAIRYVHYKKRPLMEQRRKEVVVSADPSTITGAAERKMPPRSNTSSNNFNADLPTIQQLLQSLSSSIPSGQPDRFPSANKETTEQFLQLQHKILLQQQTPGTTSSSHNVSATSKASSQSTSLLEGSLNQQQHQETSQGSNLNMNAVMLLQVQQQQQQSTAPHNSLLNVLSGLQQPGLNDQGNWQNMLQQQLLLKQLQQLQHEQEQQRQKQQQQHQMLQTLLQMQAGQPINQQFLLSALAGSSGQHQASASSSQSLSHSTQVLSSLLVRHGNPIKKSIILSESLAR